MSDSFEIKLPDDHRGLFWAFVHIEKSSSTGVLSIKVAGSGRGESKKEIAFDKGCPVAVVSNRAQDKLAQYLLNEKILNRKQLEELNSAGVKIAQSTPLIGAMMQKQWIDQAKIPEVLEKYFREKLFSSLDLSRGELKFKELESLPEKVFQVDEFRLSVDFRKALWEEFKSRLDDSYCRARFSKKLKQSFKLVGDFPLDLSATELRAWNDMSAQANTASQLDGLALKLAVVALEFNSIKWGSSGSDKVRKELEAMKSKFKKAPPFEILGVSREAGSAECKKAYIQIVKNYHPDRLPEGSDDSLKKLCEEVLAQVNEAQDIWADQDKREEWLAEEELEKQGGMAGLEKKLQAEMKLDEAILCSRRKQYAQAVKLLEGIKDLIADYPEFQVEFAFAKVMAAVDAGSPLVQEYPGFHRVFEKAIKERPQYSFAHYYQGILFKLEGVADKAIESFQKALEIEPNFQEAATEMRVIQMRQDKAKPKSKSGWFKKA